MAAWWKKVVKALTGDDIGPADDEVGAPASPSPSDEHYTEPASMAHTPVTEDASALHAANEELGRRIDSLADDVDKQFHTAAARSEEVLTRIDRLSSVMDGIAATGPSADIVTRIDRLSSMMDGLAAARDAQNGEMAHILESTQDARDHTQRLREIVASLPEIATEQAESVGSLDQRMNTVEQRTAAIADAVSGHARGLDELKEALANLNRALTSHQQAQTDLAVGQRQITDSVNDLCGRITQTIQLFKAHAQRLKQLAEAPQTRHREMQDLVISNHAQLTHASDELTQKTGVATSRATLAVVFAAIAAMAAIGSAVLVFLK